MRPHSPALALALALATTSILGTGAALAQTAAPTAAPAPVPAPAPRPVVVAALKTADGADAGTVTGYEGPMGMIFRVAGKGWPAGWHAVHLHAVGTCEAPGFTSAGGHVNHAEGARPHGLLNENGGPDLGDLQNVHVRPSPPRPGGRARRVRRSPRRPWSGPRPSVSGASAHRP
jgi:Cu-Zn family superoxide dismutase